MMPLKVMRSVMADTPIEVFAGGKLQRDWTYIDDIVAGIIAALYRPLGYRVINLGRGAPIPLNDFIEIIEALSGKAARRIEKPAPATEPTITFCDNTLARTLLGFNPQTSIRDGLAQTWAWLQSIQPTRG
jgi:UDP-glucuronate 4-epimerase